MAKSLRSKRKRKVRAEKRIVNAKKELDKLRQVAARLHQGSGSTIITKESIESNIPDVTVSDTPMSIDNNNEQSNNTTTTGKRNQRLQINTQWMNQRKIKAIKSKIKKHNTKKARRGGGSSGLSSRRAKKGIKK